MFGYATNETEDYIPLSLYVSHLLLRELADIRREGKHMNYYRKGKLVTYLRPDAKAGTTVEYGDDGKPQRIHTIVVSTRHDEFVEPLDGTPAAQLAADRQMLEQIEKDVREVLLPRVIAKLPEATRRLFDDNLTLHVNPTGKFVLGGPRTPTPGLPGARSSWTLTAAGEYHGAARFLGQRPVQG